MSLKRPSTLTATAAILCACVPIAGAQVMDAQLIAGGLSNPTMVTHAPGDMERLFVLERAGRIRVIKNGALQATDFLDLTPLVSVSVERGLLDMVFDPNFATNRYCYVRYSGTFGQCNVVRYTVNPGNDTADAANPYRILLAPNGTFVHNGGSIAFGPDGYLYVGLGDGNNLTNNNSQNLDLMLGKILRLDVSGDDFPADNDRNYRIPPTNPFIGATPGLDEIWIMGVRNPYRFAFDPANGDLWIGDVGQGGPEEIDYQPMNIANRNYGWPCMEGPNCTTNTTACVCNDPTLTLPIFAYEHMLYGCSITGGRVYRGCALAGLQGTYFFADYCTGRIISFRYVKGAITEFVDNRATDLDPPGAVAISSIVAFGEDAFGELYIVDLGGEIFKIVPQTPPPDLNLNGIPDACEPLRVGDIDLDGVVDVDDLLIVIRAWGSCPWFSCPADIFPNPVGDNVVNIDDLLLVISSWG